MVVGFNHNFRYKGEVYHIQTEDSGMKSPNIVTLLYQGGTILASKKTSYADITKIDNLEQVVEELMKEQHKEMLRCLKAGEFDAVIERYQSSKTTGHRVVDSGKSTPPLVPERQEPSAPPPVAPALAKPATEAAPKTPVAAPQVPKNSSSTSDLSLDEVILSYLMGDDK